MINRTFKRNLGMGAVLGLTLVGLGLPAVATDAVAGATAPTYQWPEAHQNPSLTGVSADPGITTANASTLGVSWMTYTGGEILASPVAAWNNKLGKDVVYIGNDGGYMMAINRQTGVPIWSVNLGGAIRSAALVEGGYVWVAPTTGGRAFKLNGATGATVCSAPIQNAAGETVDASPVIATPPGGRPTVYFAENDTGPYNGPVTALDEATCNVDFQSTPELQPGVGGVWDFLSYAVDKTGEGIILFGTADPDSAVYAIDASTGARVWRFQTYNPNPYTYDVGAGVTVSPPGNNGFSDGVAYVPNKYGIMYALDLTTGTELWSYDFGGSTPGDAAIGTPALFGTNLVFGDDSGMYDINAVTGAQIWYHANSAYGQVDGGPAILGPVGQQVVVDSDLSGAITVLSLATGAQLYKYETGSFSVGSPADASGNILETDGNGFVYDFAPSGSNGVAPTTAVTTPVNQATVPNPNGSLPLSGTASGSTPIDQVSVDIQRGGGGGAWWDGATGTWVGGPYPNKATLSAPGADSTLWSLSFPVPPSGNTYSVYASASSNGLADASIGMSAATPARSSVTVSASSSAVRLVAAVPWAGPGGVIQVQGSGFGNGEKVAVSLYGTTLTTLTASSTGSIAPANVTLPLTASFGPASLQATGQTSGDIAVAPIYVTNTWGQVGSNSEHDAADPNDKVLGHHLSVSAQTFLSQAWGFNAGSAVDGSLAVTDGLGFLADQAGTVYALNMTTGMPAWSYAIPDGQPVTTTPAISQSSLVLVAGQDGALSALHEFSGALAWSTTIGGQLNSPTVIGGTAYVTSTTGKVTAVTLATGKVAWSKSVGSVALTSAAADSSAGILIVAGSDGTVTALKLGDGSVVWTASLGGGVTATPVIGQGDVYIGSTNGTLYALVESSGASAWTFATSGPITASVADDEGQIIVGSSDGNLHYLDPATGDAQYQIVLGQPVVGVAGADNFVASLGSGGALLGSKPAATNPFAWEATQGTALSSQPTVVNGEVVVTGPTGQVDVYTAPGSPAF